MPEVMMSAVTCMNEFDAKTERLIELIRSFESVAVAFSAGVDSTVVAQAAQLVIGNCHVALRKVVNWSAKAAI